MNTKNILNICLYSLIIISYVVSFSTINQKVNNNSSDDSDKTTVNVILLLGAFLAAIMLFSIFSIILLYLSGKTNIYDKNNPRKLSFLLCNAIILSFSFIILLPSIALALDVEGHALTYSLILGSLLALGLGMVNTSYTLFSIKGQ